MALVMTAKVTFFTRSRLLIQCTTSLHILRRMSYTNIRCLTVLLSFGDKDGSGSRIGLAPDHTFLLFLFLTTPTPSFLAIRSAIPPHGLPQSWVVFYRISHRRCIVRWIWQQVPHPYCSIAAAVQPASPVGDFGEFWTILEE